jgi:hypothetical protein
MVITQEENKDYIIDPYTVKEYYEEVYEEHDMGKAIS